ncbi:Glycoside hydrolase, family 19 [Cynara cardunculus var. scolymus]|uniref:Glycoside hydrolase, family 19 n=1 Tax=Cynara cardunculus var. scolymus TaxID=59895 RepID=A0A118K4Y9_CYNCS|nr:Glycoside hydrolase, family 19 [Cynara cardunculus var. scolymus]
MKMEAKKICLLVIGMLFVILSIANADSSVPVLVKKVKGKKVCDKGWECKGWSEYCCNLTISDYFDTYQFEELFAKRNSPVAHAAGFWDYKSFITASALYQPHGFGTTGNKTTQMKEVAAFLGHVGSQTSCGYGVATGGPTAWGLCYNKEMSPSQDYCDDYYKQYNYGKIGEALKVDLLNHPEYIEQNATLAFQAAIYRWLTPMKKGQPSAHEALVGTWKPTKNDTSAKRFPGFGTTMNVLYGDRTCGKGDNDDMNAIVSHYLYYLDLMGVGREEGGPHDVLTCAEQEPFNPSAPTQASSR